MPLKTGWSRSNYFNDAWKQEIAPTLEKYMAGADIEIYLPGTSTGTMDWTTGKMTYSGSELKAYAGPARVQPRRAAQEKANNSSDTTVQVVQFQVALAPDATPLDIRPKHRVRVTDCELNPVLTKYEYVVYEVVDSSNPLEQTFWARVDQEVVRG